MTFVGSNYIRHPSNFFRHLDTRFSISNFERSSLGGIGADFRDQILVGKQLYALNELYTFHILRVTSNLQK